MFNKKIIFIFLLSVNCYAGHGGTFSVREDGHGDYTTLGSALSAQAGDLYQTAFFAISGSWTSAQPATWVSGFTTYTTAYISIFTSGEARHKGVWNDTTYRIVDSRSDSLMRLQCRDVRIDGLQFKNTYVTPATNASCIAGAISSGAGEFYVSNCLITSGDQSPTLNGNRGITLDLVGTYNNWHIYNNIIYNCRASAIYGVDILGSATWYIYSNTISSSTKASGFPSGIYLNHACKLFLKDNCSVVEGTACFVLQGAGSRTTSHNLSRDATSPDSAYRNLMPVFINKSTDFHLVDVDTSAWHNGDNLSADSDGFPFNTDIDGDIRPATWSIGADDERTVYAKKKKSIINFIE